MSVFSDLVMRDTLANRPAAGVAGRVFYDTTNSILYRDNGSAWQSIEGAGGGGGSGTVTSVDMTVPSEITLAGNPITSSGTLALSWASETQNRVFASPNGSSGTPSFRALVAADIPSLSSVYQPLDATLTAFAALTIAANSLTIGTGADAFSQTTFAANTFPARASTGSLVAKTISDFGLSLVDDADAAAGRTTLGLGAVAVLALGVSVRSASGSLEAAGAIQTNATATGAVSVDAGVSNQHELTLTGNVTITVSNLSAGRRLFLTLKQDGTGSRTIAFSNTILWPGGTTPTWTTTAGKTDVVSLACESDGTTILGWASLNH